MTILVTRGAMYEYWTPAAVIQNAHFPCGLPDCPWQCGCERNWKILLLHMTWSQAG